MNKPQHKVRINGWRPALIVGVRKVCFLSLSSKAGSNFPAEMWFYLLARIIIAFQMVCGLIKRPHMVDGVQTVWLAKCIAIFTFKASKNMKAQTRSIFWKEYCNFILFYFIFYIVLHLGLDLDINRQHNYY